jgi:hypothetical protein
MTISRTLRAAALLSTFTVPSQAQAQHHGPVKRALARTVSKGNSTLVTSIAKVIASTVIVIAKTTDKMRLGTGFAIKSGGWIITARHTVIDGDLHSRPFSSNALQMGAYRPGMSG